MKISDLTVEMTGKLRKIDLSAYYQYVLRFAAAFLLARARIFGDFAPFGAAFAGACPPTAFSVVTLAGAVAGYLTGGALWSLKYVASVIIVRAAVRILSETELGTKRFFQPMATACAVACTGFVYALEDGLSAYDISVFAVEVTLSGTCAYFYAEALSAWERRPWKSAGRLSRNIGAVILLVTLLISFANIHIFGEISVGRAAAVILVMIAAFRGGTGGGAAAGIILGAAMDVAAGSAPFFVMAYGLSAVLAGIFPKNGRAVFSVTYIMVNALTVVWMWGAAVGIPSLYETFIASVVFLLLPDTVLARASAVFPAELNGYGFFKAREYTRERTKLAAAAFRQLYETVRTAAGEDGSANPENVATVYDRAAESVCRSCRRANICWQRDYAETVDVMNHLSEKLMANCDISAEDFPGQFAEKCERFDTLVGAVNAEGRIFRCRRQYRRRLQESRGAAYNQYGDVARILRGISDELGSEIVVESALEKRLVKFLRGLDIDASVAVFRVKNGKLRVELRSPGLHLLKKDRNYLDKISALLETNLCTNEDKNTPEYMILMEAEPYKASVGAAALKKKGQKVSGDRGVYFRTDEGVMYVLISDGMGSGEEAADISSSAVSILQDFLLSGMEPSAALGILRDLMFLKNEENVESTTVDLMRTDLFTGETEIYKYGAAPSYLKKNTSIRRVTCKTFPAGLVPGREHTEPYARVKLFGGTFAVLVSDGVVSADNDKWLRELISGYVGDDPQELAALVLEAAAGINGIEDDMTVLVMRLDERN